MDDPSNSSHSDGMLSLLIALSPIGRALERLQDFSIKIANETFNHTIQNALGDVYEVVGKICDNRSIEARMLQAHLLTQHNLDKSVLRVVNLKFKKNWHSVHFIAEISPIHDEDNQRL